MAKEILQAKGVHFSYGDTPVIKGVSFKLKEGEVLGIIGSSGSGKTSFLKLLGGLLQPQKGSLLFDGEPVEGPHQRLIAGNERIKLINQDFDLMPYLTVKENMLRNSLSESNSSRNKIAHKFQQQLKLKKISQNRATDTSGGQQQRIAWAAALGARPDILLLDEPFSNMDYPLKMELIHLLKTEWKPRAMILVTHEPSDMLQLADRILVMDRGRIIQRGSSREIYERPKNVQAGRLLGPLNVLSATEAKLFDIKSEKDVYLRPHQLKISKKGVEGRVHSCLFLGEYFQLELQVSGIEKHLLVQCHEGFEQDTPIYVSIY